MRTTTKGGVCSGGGDCPQTNKIIQIIKTDFCWAHFSFNLEKLLLLHFFHHRAHLFFGFMGVPEAHLKASAKSGELDTVPITLYR